ncbi:T0131132 isoform 3 [Pan troglodytes]|uniref:T0131132 isoform 3 n=1 Tax=Pan troglodytes TaxID=9598 RepID=A0A2J8KM23_PANTR|nr:T0131132 isoform 3 [Pan troglodytes]
MAGAPPPASLPPCSLISDCCVSNQRDSVGVGPSEPGVGYSLLLRRFLSLSEKRSIRVGVTRFSRHRVLLCCLGWFQTLGLKNPPTSASKSIGITGMLCASSSSRLSVLGQPTQFI